MRYENVKIMDCGKVPTRRNGGDKAAKVFLIESFDRDIDHDEDSGREV
jgi:hypothetical protein